MGNSVGCRCSTQPTQKIEFYNPEISYQHTWNDAVTTGPSALLAQVLRRRRKCADQSQLGSWSTKTSYSDDDNCPPTRMTYRKTIVRRLDTETSESTSSIATPASEDLNSNRTVEKIDYSNADWPEATTTYDDESLSAFEWNPNLQSNSDVNGENQEIKGIEMDTVCNEKQDFLNVERKEEEDRGQLVYVNPNTPAQLQNLSTIAKDSDFKLEHIRLSSSDNVPVSTIQDHVSSPVERRSSDAVERSKDSGSTIFNLVEYTEQSECTAKKTEVSTKHELPPVPNIRVEDGIVVGDSNVVRTSGFSEEGTESSTDDTEFDLS